MSELPKAPRLPKEIPFVAPKNFQSDQTPHPHCKCHTRVRHHCMFSHNVVSHDTVTRHATLPYISFSEDIPIVYKVKLILL